MMIPSVNLLHLLVYGICFISVINPAQGKAGAQTQVQTPCVLPPFPEHGSYTVDDHPNAKPGDMVSENTFLSYSCQEGYDLGSLDSPSCNEGEWSNVQSCLIHVSAPSNLTSGSSEKSIQQEIHSNAVALFSQDYYKIVISHNAENLVTSPLSVDVALALLSLGAQGTTERELLAALHLPDAALTRATYPPTLQRLAALEGVALQIVNKVYVMEGPQYRLNSTYRKDAGDIFQAEIESVNFADSAVAANTINSWVKEKTNGKITDIFDETSLDSQTRVVLINAVYFKGKWNIPFDPEVTYKHSFQVSAAETTEVDMMQLEDNFRYAELGDIRARALELPYGEGQVSMVILLPDKVDGLHEVEKAANYTQILKSLYHPWQGVSVKLPRFKIESYLNLRETLTKMGIESMFSDGAELGGLLEGGESVKVSDVVQKAYIEVNEEGAEAAAVTAPIMSVRSFISGPPPLMFTVDHPFSFYLVGKGDVLLFSGRVTRP